MKVKSRGRNKYNHMLNLMNHISEFIKFVPFSIRKNLFECFRNTKGLKGLGLRYILFKSISLKSGNNVSIHPNVYIFSPEKLSVGNNVSIHPMSYIDAGGYIDIGSDVSIAHGTSILSSTHNIKDISIPIKDQGVKIEKTIIGNDVWIGAKATILMGVIIKEGSVIGTGSVVNKNFDEYSIIVGVPGKVNKRR